MSVSALLMRFYKGFICVRSEFGFGRHLDPEELAGALAGAKRAKGGQEALVSAAIVASLRVLCAASWLLSIILTTNRLLPSSWRFK